MPGTEHGRSEEPGRPSSEPVPNTMQINGSNLDILILDPGIKYVCLYIYIYSIYIYIYVYKINRFMCRYQSYILDILEYIAKYHP